MAGIVSGPAPAAPSGHRCRRAGRCAQHQLDDTGRPFGAPTLRPHTVCDACAGRIGAAAVALPADYAGLEQILAVHTPPGEKVSGTAEPAVPPRLDVLDLQAEIDHLAWCWAEPLAEQLGIGWDTTRMGRCRPGPRLQRAAALLAAHTGLLLRTGPTELVGWIAGHPVILTRDGVDGGVALLDAHQRAQLLITGGSGDVRLPLPCPTCEGVLIRANGAAQVDCRGCGRVWPEADWRRLCLVQAQDYRDVAA
jgi:hypothetical protein